MDALDVLCAQLTRDLFAIAKFLLYLKPPAISGTGEDTMAWRYLWPPGADVISAALCLFNPNVYIFLRCTMHSFLNQSINQSVYILNIIDKRSYGTTM